MVTAVSRVDVTVRAAVDLPYDQVSDFMIDDADQGPFAATHAGGQCIRCAPRSFASAGRTAATCWPASPPWTCPGPLPPAFDPPHAARASTGAFWIEEGDSFVLVCFRSVAQYVYDLLKNRGAPGSAPVL